MKPLDKVLNELDGYLLSINRNPDEGVYELQVGIPKDWVYKETDTVGYEEIHKAKEGSLINVYGLEEDVVIDDLIDFVRVIIETNKRIEQMKEDFDIKMEETKKELQEEVQGFYDKLEEVKESSFTTMEEELKAKQKKDSKKIRETIKLEDKIDKSKVIDEDLAQHLST